MNDFAENFDAFTPERGTARTEPTYAMVEIFGHRQHWAEIRDVDLAGGKLLEVRDVDTRKVHLYGAAAIFSLTMLEAADIEAHLADVKRLKEQHERWSADYAREAQARLDAPKTYDNDFE